MLLLKNSDEKSLIFIIVTLSRQFHLPLPTSPSPWNYWQIYHRRPRLSFTLIQMLR